MVTSEWKMIDQQGKKNLSRIFRCISGNFSMVLCKFWGLAKIAIRQSMMSWLLRNLSQLFDENRHRINLYCHLKLATLMTRNIK